MKIALIQGNYVPWAGYFSVIHAVDLFLVYEDVQYTKNDFRNRNWLLDQSGAQVWLTIPVRHERLGQTYREIKIASRDWVKKHPKIAQQLLAKCHGWGRLRPELNSWFEEAAKFEYLWEINRFFLSKICEYLSVKTPIEYVESFDSTSSPSKRVAEIVKQHGASVYLSGPAAKSYIRQEDFTSLGVDIEWCNYASLIESLLGNNHEKAQKIMQAPESILRTLTDIP